MAIRELLERAERLENSAQSSDALAAQALRAIEIKITTKVFPVPPSDSTTMVEGTDANGNPIGQIQSE